MSDEERFIVPNTVIADAARRTAEHAIRDGILRPEDIHTADIEAPELFHVPFWRLDVTVDGMHVGFPISIQTREKGPSIPIPLPGRRHRQSVMLIIARRLFPYQPKLTEQTKRGSLFSGVTTWSGWRGLEIPLHAMTPFERPGEGELVEPDVSRETAEHEAGQRATWNVRPDNAIYASYKPEINAAACCFYPLWIVRYSYDGHATNTPGDAFWVGVSGRSGEVVGSHHPSALKSVARKLRSLLTFG